MLWGRLGYDPSVPDEVFDAAARRHLGVSSNTLVEEWREASRVIPTAFTAYSLGPDHRDHAPELEWGGTTDDFIQGEPFDSHVFRSIKEELAYRATGGIDGREPLEGAVPMPAASSSMGAPVPQRVAARARSAAAVGMLSHLAHYYDSRFRAAIDLATAEADGANDSVASGAMSAAAEDWRPLVRPRRSQVLQGFPIARGWGASSYTWASSLPLVTAEAKPSGGPQAFDCSISPSVRVGFPWRFKTTGSRAR